MLDITLSSIETQFFALPFLNVDTVVMTGAGGVQNPAYTSGSTQFIIDDVRPPPPARQTMRNEIVFCLKTYHCGLQALETSGRAMVCGFFNAAATGTQDTNLTILAAATGAVVPEPKRRWRALC